MTTMYVFILTVIQKFCTNLVQNWVAQNSTKVVENFVAFALGMHHCHHGQASHVDHESQKSCFECDK